MTVIPSRSAEVAPSAGASVTVDHGALGQLAYHVRWSAALAAGGRGEDSVPHAMLAAALLDVLGGPALESAISTFDLPPIIDPSGASTEKQRDVAVQLGLQLVAHFTSEGRHDLADVYQEATRRIGVRA